MNIVLCLLFLGTLLSGCVVLEWATFFYIDTTYNIAKTLNPIHRGDIQLRGSCSNQSKGEVAVKIVEIDGQPFRLNPNLGSFSNIWPIELSEGHHVIGLKIDHISRIQKLTLQFSSKHRYRLSATFDRDTKKFQTHFWDEREFPLKELSSFEFEGTRVESEHDKLEQDTCY